MSVIKKLKWYIVFLLLNRNERSVISSLIKSGNKWALDYYADCLGETFEEFIKETSKLKDRINW